MTKTATGFDKPLYVLPFDHRGTFKKNMFGWSGTLTAEQAAQISSFKQVIYEALQAAVAAGIDYPYACATGNCATCISRLEDGKVSLLPYGDACLNKAQIASGLTLPCRARPRSDVTVNWLARSGG